MRCLTTRKLRGRRWAVLAEELDGDFWRQASQNSDALGRWLETAASALLDLRDHLDEPGWDGTLQALARWRRDKRQLHESTMPPKSELTANPFLPRPLKRLSR